MSRIEVGTVVRVVFKNGNAIPYGDICVVTRAAKGLTTVRSLRSGVAASYREPTSLELLSDVDA